MKALAFALVLSLSLLGAERARAADLPLPGGAPIPPSSYYPVSPPVNWGGVYIGLNGGYGLGKSNWSNSLGSTGNFPVNGGVFGGTLGINYAGFGDWVLLGFEGDFDWSGASGSGGCSVLDAGLQGEPVVLGPGATCQTRIDWLSTFRSRAGYTWTALPLLCDRRRRRGRLPDQLATLGLWLQSNGAARLDGRCRCRVPLQ